MWFCENCRSAGLGEPTGEEEPLAADEDDEQVQKKTSLQKKNLYKKTSLQKKLLYKKKCLQKKKIFTKKIFSKKNFLPKNLHKKKLFTKKNSLQKKDSGMEKEIRKVIYRNPEASTKENRIRKYFGKVTKFVQVHVRRNRQKVRNNQNREKLNVMSRKQKYLRSWLSFRGQQNFFIFLFF